MARHGRARHVVVAPAARSTRQPVPTPPRSAILQLSYIRRIPPDDGRSCPRQRVPPFPTNARDSGHDAPSPESFCGQDWSYVVSWPLQGRKYDVGPRATCPRPQIRPRRVRPARLERWQFPASAGSGRDTRGQRIRARRRSLAALHPARQVCYRRKTARSGGVQAGERGFWGMQHWQARRSPGAETVDHVGRPAQTQRLR
jgi:hypothetical protein